MCPVSFSNALEEGENTCVESDGGAPRCCLSLSLELLRLLSKWRIHSVNCLRKSVSTTGVYLPTVKLSHCLVLPFSEDTIVWDGL